MDFQLIISTFNFLIFTLTPFTADKVEIIKEDGVSIDYLLGNVIIEQESTKITCHEARLNETAGNVILNENVKIKDKTGELEAQFGSYYFKEKKAYLAGKVILSTENEIISSDSLSYDGVKRFVRMFNNVKIIDKKNKLTADGGEGWYDLEKEQGNLVQKPSVEIERSSGDTITKERAPMRVTAREFELNTKENRFYGFDSVIAIIDSITVFCDTFFYNLQKKDGLVTRPIVVEKENELKGREGQFKLKNEDIEYFTVHEGGARYYTKEGSKNVIEGQTITILFKESKAIKIFVQGTPKGVLTLKKKKEDVNH